MIEIVFKEDEKKSIAYDFDKKIGECNFEETNDIWNITHTEVNGDYQGQGIAKKLVENVIQNAKRLNKRLEATCSYAQKVIKNKRIFEVKDRTPILVNELLDIWEDSVKATHLFLSSEEIEMIKKYVPQALKEVKHLVISKNENNEPIAFMGIEDGKLEMLFIKNSEREKGIGKKLLNYGIEKYNVSELVVNEQNPNAKAFYEHLGFKVYKRSEVDEQGNPYPILYMKLEK